MKPIRLTIDEGSLRRPAVVARRVTRSERCSRSNRVSLQKKLGDQAIENVEQTDIYFDKIKRRTYFKSVIDHYFIPHDHQASQYLHQSESNIALGPPLLLRDCATSESSRKGRDSISFSRVKLKSRISLMDFNSMVEMSSLPIIEEGAKGMKRPVSEHKPSSFISLDKDKEKEKEREMDESLFYQSTKSFMASSQTDQRNSSYTFITIRKGGKRFGKTKVFHGRDNQQLQREMTAKKVGMQVLWKTATNDSSLEFPVFKTLRQLCYSMVEEKSGDEPISIINPTHYYSSLFANHCEEFIDIAVALVKGVAKGKGMISNNQIRLQNVVKVGEKQFVLSDWGCAAIREGFSVQGRTFNKDLGPLCREDNEWLLAPEYLSPEMLRATQTGYYQHLWRQKGGVGSCDIWSIGCLLFELITLVPLSSHQYCMVKGREKKRGIFGNKLRTAERILSKQRNFKNYVVRSMKEEMRLRKQLRVCDKLLEVIPRMLEESVEQRITADEILLKLG